MLTPPLAEGAGSDVVVVDAAAVDEFLVEDELEAVVVELELEFELLDPSVGEADVVVADPDEEAAAEVVDGANPAGGSALCTKEPPPHPVRPIANQIPNRTRGV